METDAFFTVMIAGVAKGGMEEYVEHLMKKIMHHSRNHKGCVVYNVHRSINNSQEFMMYSVWRSQKDFEQHNQEKEMKEFKTELSQAIFEVQSPKTYWTLLN